MTSLAIHTAIKKIEQVELDLAELKQTLLFEEKDEVLDDEIVKQELRRRIKKYKTDSKNKKGLIALSDVIAKHKVR